MTKRTLICCPVHPNWLLYDEYANYKECMVCVREAAAGHMIDKPTPEEFERLQKFQAEENRRIVKRFNAEGDSLRRATVFVQTFQGFFDADPLKSFQVDWLIRNLAKELEK